MFRIASIVVAAVAFCTLQSGCCCCQMPAQMLRFGAANAINNQPPIVIQPPPVVVNPPDIQFKDMQPPKDFGKDLGNPFQKKEYVYSQTTGQLKLGNEVIGTGYSGRGAAKNNPGMQNQPKTGPIPAGPFTIMTRRNDPQTGEPIIETLPTAPSNARGRFPGESFRIRCESNPPGMGDAGDIVLPRAAIDKIDINGFPNLKVVP
jgi:hypothetical protein